MKFSVLTFCLFVILSSANAISDTLCLGDFYSVEQNSCYVLFSLESRKQIEMSPLFTKWEKLNIKIKYLKSSNQIKIEAIDSLNRLICYEYL